MLKLPLCSMETFQVPLHVILHFKSVAIVLLQHFCYVKEIKLLKQ